MEEVRHVPEGGGGNLGKYCERGTASVASEGEPTKSGYLTFDQVEISTINWRPTGGQLSEYSIPPRVELSSDPSMKPTGS